MPSAKNPRQLDWEAVWKGLNWDDESRAQTLERERLQQRARQYAAPIKQRETPPEDSKTILTFELSAERYGVEVTHVHGIRPLAKVTRVPGAPAFFRGITNVRGQIITVLDLRAFFNIPQPPDAPEPDELVLVRAYKLELGLLAHEVTGVVTVPPAAIKPLDNTPYALGLTTGRVVLLNLEQLFADERLIVGGGLTQDA